MTCTPMAVFAIHLDSNREMNEPPKPSTAENTSNAPRVQAVLREVAVQAEHTDDDGQDQHDRDVGGDQEDDAFHGLEAAPCR